MLLTEYTKKLRESKAVINSLNVSASNGIVKSKDSNLLHCNGIHIESAGHGQSIFWIVSAISDIDFVALKAWFLSIYSRNGRNTSIVDY